MTRRGASQVSSLLAPCLPPHPLLWMGRGGPEDADYITPSLLLFGVCVQVAGTDLQPQGVQGLHVPASPGTGPSLRLCSWVTEVQNDSGDPSQFQSSWPASPALAFSLLGKRSPVMTLPKFPNASPQCRLPSSPRSRLQPLGSTSSVSLS